MILTKSEFKLHKDYIIHLLNDNGIVSQICRENNGYEYRLYHKCEGRNDACCFISIYQYGQSDGLKARIKYWLNMGHDYEIWGCDDELGNPNAYKWLLELIQAALKYQRLLLNARGEL